MDMGKGEFAADFPDLMEADAFEDDDDLVSTEKINDPAPEYKVKYANTAGSSGGL